MTTTGRRNYVVFIMDGTVAFAGRQKDYNEWKYWHVPGQGLHGVRPADIAKHGMTWEYFARKHDMEEYVAKFSGEFA